MVFKDYAEFSDETIAWALTFLLTGPKPDQISPILTPRIIHSWLADGDC